MLLIKIGLIGAIAVGSYSVPEEAGGDRYTALAIFGGVFVPIGLTPIINITALGLGLGLNRRLIVPEDLNQIPGFMLIQALDRPEEIANDPLGALLPVPQRRAAAARRVLARRRLCAARRSDRPHHRGALSPSIAASRSDCWASRAPPCRRTRRRW